MNQSDKEQYARAAQIVRQTLALSPGDQPGFIASACGENEDLLELVTLLVAAGGADTRFPDQSAEDGITELGISPETQEDDQPGKIGPYTLIEKIGEGGFGEVYAAEQSEPVKREVALKILKAGMDSRAVLSRFEAERQTLALMDHPNVAKILDAGQTPRGRPYFVMELVTGTSIVDYCDEHRLSIQQRLELVVPVCRAVQHAHQKGIIHRDLKPSNILVSSTDGLPTPKVIDFGIAKATAGALSDLTLLTRRGELIGTPAYMSPEQLAGTDIDTRTDIYSLGVVLYRLMTGSMPYRFESFGKPGYADIQKAVQESEPIKPSDRLKTKGRSHSESADSRGTSASALIREVKGEIDWIVMKAMEKDRTRRYESASGFAADLERHLNDEPVTAGPPSVTYRFKKFAKRHKIAMVTSAAVAATVLAALVQTNIERSRVERAQQELAAVAEFQADILRKINPSQMGTGLAEDLRARLIEGAGKLGAAEPEIQAWLASFDQWMTMVNVTDAARTIVQHNVLSNAVLTLDQKFADQPLVSARLRDTIGETYRDLGLYQPAITQIGHALAIRSQVLGEQHPLTLDLTHRLGFVLHLAGELDQAESLFRESLAGRQAVLGEQHPATLRALNDLGYLLVDKGLVNEAEPYVRRAFDGRMAVLGPTHRDTLTSRNDLGRVFEHQGEYEKAATYYREAIAGRRETLGSDDSDTLTSINNLGKVLMDLGKPEDAGPFLQEALTGRRRLLGSNHPHTLHSISNLGAQLRRVGDAAGAERHYEEALAGRRRFLGDQHQDTLSSINNLAFIFQAQGRLNEARPLYLEALQGLQATLGSHHPNTLLALNNMGFLLLGEGKPKEGEPYFRSALEGYEQTLGRDHPDTSRAMSNLGVALHRQGKSAEAEPILREVMHYRQKTFGGEHPRTLSSMSNYGNLLIGMEQFAQAQSVLSLAAQQSKQSLGDHLITGVTLQRYGQVQMHIKAYDNAETQLLEAHRILSQVAGPDHGRTMGVAGDLADLYLTWGKPHKSGEWRVRSTPQSQQP